MPQAVAAIGTWWAGLGATAKFFITLAATFAISAVTAKLFGPKAPKASFSGTQTTSRTALEYRRHGYGIGVLGGAIFWNNTRGTNNRWLDYQIAYCDHEAELIGVYLDDTYIPIGSISWTPPATDGTLGTGSGEVLVGKYTGNSVRALEISWYPGTPNQLANEKVHLEYDELDINHRARGVFNILFSLLYQEETAKVWEKGAPRDYRGVFKLRRIFQRRRYALNLDPDFETAKLAVSTNRSKWFGTDLQDAEIDSGWTSSAGTLSITDNDDGSENIFSERIPVDTAKRYRVKVTARQTQGDRFNYIGVAFYDSAGDEINNTSVPVSDATGWAAVGAYHYYLSNQVLAGTYTDYETTFGPGGIASIPTGAVTMSLVGLFSRDGAVGTNTTIDLQDFAVFEEPVDAVPRHDLANDTTWEWSENPADCTADYLTYFMTVDPIDEMDWGSVIDASLACDELVDIPGSQTQKRYTCNGVWLTSTEHEKNLEDLKNCFNAKLSYTGGRWVMWAGVWQPSQISWDHTALAAGNVTLQGSADPNNRFNLVKGFYIDNDRDYKPVEFNPATNAAYTARDAGENLDFDIDYKFINDEYQCQRCAKHKLDQFDNMEVITVPMNEQGARAYPGLMVDWTLEEFGYINKTFRCIEWRPQEDGTFAVTFQEDFEARYADLLVGEYTIKSPNGITIPDQTVPAPANLVVTGKEGAVELTFAPGPNSLYDVTEVWVATGSNNRASAVKVADVTGSNFLHVVGDTQLYYYWVRNRWGPEDWSEYFPVSDVSGLAGQATSASSIFYQYIKPTNGTAIRNGAGTLTLEARQVSGALDTLLAAGTVRLYVGTTEVTVANGYATGSDGFTGVFDAGDINGDVVVELKDGPTGDIIDSETLVDIADGVVGGDALYGFIESDNGLAWTRAPNAGAWTPAQTTIDLDATFVQAGVAVARIARRITLNTGNGTLTASVIAHGSGDLNTARVTVTVSGSASTAITVEYAYSFGGDAATVAQTVFSSQGGIDGVAGDDGQSAILTNIYRRSATAPATPTGGEYNFTTNTLTPPVGWSTSPPAGVDPLYVSTGSWSVLGTTGTDTSTVWTPPAVLVQDGADGIQGPPGDDGVDGNSVYYAQIFRRAASAPTTPTGGSYNFATQTLTPPSLWSATPPANDGNPLYVSSAVAEAPAGGTDSSLTWVAPQELVSDGTDGADGATGTPGADGADGNSVYYAQIFRRSATQPATPTGGQYNFGTQVLTPPSLWSATPPASDGNPMWVCTAVAEVTGTTGIDTTLTWTTPSELVSDGADGSDGATGTPGADGDDGISVYVANVYQRTNAAPATPTGGSYNFGTSVLTPPSGWLTSPPEGQDPLYVSSASFSVVGQTGIDTTTTWSTPAVLVVDGYSGVIATSRDWDFTTTTFDGMGAWNRYNGAAANMSFLKDEPGPFLEYPMVLQVNGTSPATAPGWFGGLKIAHAFDINRSYIYYCWVKKFGSSVGLYMGFGNVTPAVVDAVGGDVGDANPYYVANVASQIDDDKWYLAVGVIWAKDAVSADQDIAGIYDPATGLRIYDGQEFEWSGDNPNPDHVWRMAFYSNTTAFSDTQGVQYTRPAVWVRDGTEPSIDAVLGAGAIGGNYRDVKFQRSVTAPAAPTGDNPAGWFDSIPSGTEGIWQTVGTKTASGVLIGVWSTPTRIQSLVYRGVYSAVASYLQDDVVIYSERTYICTQATTGNAPSGANTSNTWWDLLAGKGDPGDGPSAFVDTIAITSLPANLLDLAVTAGYDGIGDATVTFNLGSGVTGGGTANGGDGITTGTWPTGIATIDLQLNVNGTVRGGGGRGGDGGDGIGGGGSGQNGSGGGSGGDAINCQTPIDITVFTGASVLGASGGGGGGGGATSGIAEPLDYGGGGGGGGAPNGTGGSGGIGIGSTTSGSPGTVSSGGAGGTASGAGGAGGAGRLYGQSGLAGQDGTGNQSSGFGGAAGPAGYAIRKNGFTVNVTNSGGTVTGTVG